MAAKKGADEKRMVTIVIPREPGNDEQMAFVALNGVAYNIPRGKPVDVPEGVADIYYRSIEAQEYAYSYSDEAQREMHVVQGAPV